MLQVTHDLHASAPIINLGMVQVTHDMHASAVQHNHCWAPVGLKDYKCNLSLISKFRHGSGIFGPTYIRFLDSVAAE